MRLGPWCCVFAMLAVGGGPAAADLFVVDDLADAVDAAPGNGICATGRGTCTLRAAVQEANALAGADQITLGPGVHELTIAGADEDASATGDLDIAADLTIAGLNAYPTVIDANGLDRVLDHAPGGPASTLTVRDLTLTGGSVDGRGGGIRYARAVDADRIIVRGNTANAGGGLAAADEGQPWLDLGTSIVSLNAADSGGGIDTGLSFASTVDLSIVIANSAVTRGGGVSFEGTLGNNPVLFDRVTVYGNNVTGGANPRGGGMHGESGLVLDQSWIGHNLVGAWGAAAPDAAGRGGGLYMGVGDGTVTNTTVEGNLADDAGAVGTEGVLTVTHATIARNAATRGGAIRLYNIASVHLQNTIVGENTPVNCFGTLPIDLGSNLETSNSTCTPIGDYDFGVNLEPLGDYGGPTRSMPPLPDSGAVEGGEDAGINVDQRGVLRPQLAQFDIGAVELKGRRARPRYAGGFTSNPHPCDRDRNGRVDFADLDRLIASFPVVGGRFQGNATQRLRNCVAACTHAGCPAVALIPKPRQKS